MSLFTVTIGSDSFEVYGGASACATAANGSGSSDAVAFRALSDDDQARKLVDATQMIDSFAWQGTADALGGTTLQWPRSGLVDSSGATISDATQLVLVNKAAFLLAMALASDGDIASATDAGSNVKSMGAGPAHMELFRPTSTLDGNATVLPVVVNRLIGNWLASASPAVASAATGAATGTSCRDDFSRCRADGLEWPL